MIYTKAFPAFFLAVSLCAAAPAAAVIHGGRGRAQGMGPERTMHATSEIAGVGEQAIRRMLSHKPDLELTGIQEKALLDIRTELLKNLTVVINSLMQCQGEYQALVEAENPDFKAIREKAREMTTIETYVTALSVDAFDKAFAVLTEKQKNIWAVLAKKRNEEMRIRMLQQMNSGMPH